MIALCNVFSKKLQKCLSLTIFFNLKYGTPRLSVQAFLAVKAEAKGFPEDPKSRGLGRAAVSLLHTQMLPGSGTAIQTPLHSR